MNLSATCLRARAGAFRASKRIFAIAILLGLALSEQSLGQDKGTPITFHVTAVHSEDAHDWEERCHGDCHAQRYTVEGYSDATEYVLTCVEVTAHKPSMHLVTVCIRLHANNDYAARLMSDAIAFGEYKPQPPSGPPPPLEADYEIVSEKEVNKQKR
jgi:hypothetical protein